MIAMALKLLGLEVSDFGDGLFLVAGISRAAQTFFRTRLSPGCGRARFLTPLPVCSARIVFEIVFR